jgi:hypothetical protein
LTEKLLLFGRAIQLAGEVKARGERRWVRSDWMAVERERGISVSRSRPATFCGLHDIPDYASDRRLALWRNNFDQRREAPKSASLKASSRRSPCASIVATTLASWTWRPPKE